MDIFDECTKIDRLLQENEHLAKEKMLELVQHCRDNNIEQISIMNHILRNMELYDLMSGDMIWQDEFAMNLFKDQKQEQQNATLQDTPKSEGDKGGE